MSLRKNGEVKLKWKIQAIIWRSNMKQRITEKAGEKNILERFCSVPF